MPILFARPTYEWVARVNQKHKQLAELQLSAEEKQTLNRWIEIEFVRSMLELEGVEIDREQVARIVSLPASSVGATEPATATSLLESLRTVTSIAREQGKDSALSVKLLLKLNFPTGGQGLRNVGDTASKVTAENLPAVLDSACQWFSADSFAELHPIEQASIVFLRMIEIRPCDQRNERTALVAASLFTLRSGLPPIIIDPETAPAYCNALNEGLRMNTKPMVEFVAQSVEESLTHMINVIKVKSRKS